MTEAEYQKALQDSDEMASRLMRYCVPASEPAGFLRLHCEPRKSGDRLVRHLGDCSPPPRPARIDNVMHRVGQTGAIVFSSPRLYPLLFEFSSLHDGQPIDHVESVEVPISIHAPDGGEKITPNHVLMAGREYPAQLKSLASRRDGYCEISDFHFIPRAQRLPGFEIGRAHV